MPIHPFKWNEIDGIDKAADKRSNFKDGKLIVPRFEIIRIGNRFKTFIYFESL